MTEIALLLTSGDGPVECRIALKALCDILAEAARSQSCTYDLLPGPHPDSHGPKSALVTITGDGAETLAREFSGSIRFIFKSPVRPDHQRQNWFVGVRQIENEDEQTEELAMEDIRFETLRAGGPGGQHQNTTDSAVRATHIPSGMTVVCRSERSQHRNKATAIRQLARMLALLGDERRERNKTNRFVANRSLERGNAVKTFRL